MSNEHQSKASKLNQHGIPWAAVVVAALGWYDARSTADDAVDDAGTKAKQAQVSAAEYSEVRARNAWEVVQGQFDAQQDRLGDLEGWIVQLEEFIEDHVEEDSPRTAREREGREARLAEIRIKKARRSRARSREPEPEALPDYGAVQKAMPDFADLDVE